MAEAHRFSHESLQDSETIGDYLRALAEGFESGSLSLASDDETLTLRPRGLLRLRIRGQRGRYRGRLRINVSWRVQVADEVATGADALHIQSDSSPGDSESR